MTRGKAGTLAPHGENPRYSAGCRCDPCRLAHQAYQRAWRRSVAYGKPFSNVPSIGTVRRLQALVALGWSFTQLDKERGLGTSATAKILARTYPTVQREVAAEIAALYDRLSMRPGASSRARRLALARGWVPPLAWDDIDDPNEAPNLAALRDDPVLVDEVAVARVVNGGTVRLTPAERLIAIRRLVATGHSDAVIAARCGVTARTVLRDRENHDIPTGNPWARTHTLRRSA